MYYDVISMKKSSSIWEFGKKLGFDQIIFKEDFDELNVVVGKDDLFNRKSIEKKIDVLLDPHVFSAKDHLHFRRGGLNQVSCKLAYKNKVIIAFSLDKLKDPCLMGRAMQDIRLCKKYHVNVAIFTLAKNKYSMRAMEDMKSLCRVLGMDGKEAKNAIGCINIKFINEKKG